MAQQNPNGELISSLMDGDIGEREVDRRLDKLTSCAQSRDMWKRYHLIGDAMRGESIARSTQSVADRVASMLEDEPAILAPNNVRRKKLNWTQPVAGAAIAASVAVATVIGLGTSDPQDVDLLDGQPLMVRTTPVSGNAIPVMPASGFQTVSGTHWSEQAPAVENKLNRYLIEHNERSNAAAYRGTAPYASFLGYDQQR